MNMSQYWLLVETWLSKYSLQVVGAIAILVLGWIAAKLLRNFFKKLLVKASVEQTIIGFLSNLIYGLLITIVILMALGQLNVETGSLIAIIGAAGLAIGFALRDSLSNFAAGIMIIFFKIFKVGDYIEGSGTAGVVEEIHIFVTKLKSPDNKVIYVPNGGLIAGVIVNYSEKDTRRVDMVFGISYDDDIDKAKGILAGILENDSRVLKDPAPQIVLSALADSSVNFNVRPWVNSADYWGVYFDTTEAVKKRFDVEGISIPYPQRDVHLYQQGNNN
ncbi:MAG: mechanosensitive ion channel [Melioribacteraceae bacterium]|nr:mechanosensitive ion channel [Melioribacteraceae bacterium]MCF8355334.1 mechanosensitive ion channel [Melioribacteraceae bacterium]MCF8392352.1 mechanosensitive ion channel [Melioribacteraceae bacterium]MCF8417872.1 mechanosensitive ion channel [Melioribacteraceae bacterium]